MPTSTDIPVATNPYPITLTREDLVDARACQEDLAAFDAMCPTGVLTITDAHAHSALLGTALAAYEAWAIEEGLLPPICVHGPDSASAIAGHYGHAIAGHYGHAIAGYMGRATAGHGGHATAGEGGHATAGHGGHATAGYGGRAVVGDYGHATAAHYGRAAAGAGGTLRLAYEAGGRQRWAIAYVGEDGIEPDVAYKVIGGKVVRA